MEHRSSRRVRRHSSLSFLLLCIQCLLTHQLTCKRPITFTQMHSALFLKPAPLSAATPPHYANLLLKQFKLWYRYSRYLCVLPATVNLICVMRQGVSFCTLSSFERVEPFLPNVYKLWSIPWHECWKWFSQMLFGERSASTLKSKNSAQLLENITEFDSS